MRIKAKGCPHYLLMEEWLLRCNTERREYAISSTSQLNISDNESTISSNSAVKASDIIQMIVGLLARS